MLFDLASGHPLAASLREMNIEPDINNTEVFKCSSGHQPSGLSISSVCPLTYTPPIYWAPRSSARRSVRRSSVRTPSRPSSVILHAPVPHYPPLQPATSHHHPPAGHQPSPVPEPAISHHHPPAGQLAVMHPSITHPLIQPPTTPRPSIHPTTPNHPSTHVPSTHPSTHPSVIQPSSTIHASIHSSPILPFSFPLFLPSPFLRSPSSTHPPVCGLTPYLQQAYHMPGPVLSTEDVPCTQMADFLLVLLPTLTPLRMRAAV